MNCTKCGFACPAKAAYCQNCGNQLKQPRFNWSATKSWAGVGVKGTSIAPLVSLAIENQAEKQQASAPHSALAPVLRPTAEQWYCPTCGEPNGQNAAFCKGCGRDFG